MARGESTACLTRLCYGGTSAQLDASSPAGCSVTNCSNDSVDADVFVPHLILLSLCGDCVVSFMYVIVHLCAVYFFYLSVNVNYQFLFGK